MLATMRPAQIHTPSSSSIQRVDSSHSAASVGPSARMPADTSADRLASDVDATKRKQNVPGLLTLTQPLESQQGNTSDEGSSRGGAKDRKAKGKKAKQASDGQSSDDRAGPTRAARKKKSSPSEQLKADEQVLSRSAPTSTHEDGWDMPSRAANSEIPNATSTLNWQQQLLAAQPPPKEKKKAANKKDKSGSSTPKNGRPISTPASTKDSALTWQQELLSSNKPRGPTFDVFADAKDAATFGSGDEGPHQQQKKGSKKGKRDTQNRRRAGSMSKIDPRASQSSHKNGGGHGSHTNGGPAGPVHLGGVGMHMSSSSSSTGPPSTPDKLAYAGPNFHNSPSPASLPMPKFLRAKGVPMGLSTSASNSAVGQSSPFAREAALQQQHANHVNAAAAASSSASGESSDGYDDGNADVSFTDSAASRFVRGGTAPPDLTTFADRLQTSQKSPSANADDPRSLTIENLLAKMMRPT